MREELIELVNFWESDPTIKMSWVRDELEEWTHAMAVDASTSWGTGGWWETKNNKLRAFQYSNESLKRWIPVDQQHHLGKEKEDGEIDLHINILEFIGIIALVAKCAASWRDRKVTLYSDNTAAAAWANGTARPRAPWRSLYRYLIKKQVKYSFKLRVEYTNTYENTGADELSRKEAEWVWIGGEAVRVERNNSIRTEIKNLFKKR